MFRSHASKATLLNSMRAGCMMGVGTDSLSCSSLLFGAWDNVYFASPGSRTAVLAILTIRAICGGCAQ